ncbi:hypothetical protein [Marinomonas ostreistagni]|uniref:hypothetical protein n=1 Tax=Marinomonas ostreistagni TaxID=359209 RepID=UPI00195032CD|nr:hypothetical protein [Marinomonas ostreistagni]MBM6550219.1 hypothetical protein [Marinomonas ostreistagni]
MKKLMALTAATIATASMTTTVLAADDQNVVGDLRDARASYEALSTQLELMGYEAQDVNFNGPVTMGQKVEVYEERHDQLQEVYNELSAAQ